MADIILSLISVLGNMHCHCPMSSYTRLPVCDYKLLQNHFIVSPQMQEFFFLFQEEYAQMASALDKGAEAGWLRPVIAQEFPLAEVAAAHREVIQHHQGSTGKLIMSI